MPRPEKPLSDEEIAAALVLRHRNPPMGWRLIARSINEGRGVFKKTGKARRECEVSHEHVRQTILKCQKTQPSNNVLRLFGMMLRQEIQVEVDGRLTEPPQKDSQ